MQEKNSKVMNDSKKKDNTQNHKKNPFKQSFKTFNIFLKIEWGF